jgi:hypothetical protein
MLTIERFLDQQIGMIHDGVVNHLLAAVFRAINGEWALLQMGANRCRWAESMRSDGCLLSAHRPFG